MPSDWLQPLLDLNGIIFDDIDDANRFMGALMPLYNRVNAARLRDENLCPFDLSKADDLEEAQRQAHAPGCFHIDFLKFERNRA